MTPEIFEMTFPPRKGEVLSQYITRIIEDNHQVKGTIYLALNYFSNRIQEAVQERQDDRIDADLFRVQSELAALEKKHAALMRKQAALPSMISKLRVESAIRVAVEGMRERAAQLVEGRDGEPTVASEEIRAIPDPNIERLMQQVQNDGRR